MIELNIGSLQIKIGRPKPVKVNLLEGQITEAIEKLENFETPEPKAYGVHAQMLNEPNAHPKLHETRAVAIKHGWREVWHRIDEGRVRFKKGKDDIVDVWYTKMTVGTIITHPTKGRGQLFRKHVSKGLLEDIFKNPRVHTGEGYYKA